MADELDTSVRQRDGGVFVVTAAGELDIATSPTLERVLDEVADGRPQTVLLELDHVTFVDSSGLRLLVELRNRFNAQDPRPCFWSTECHPPSSVSSRSRGYLNTSHGGTSHPTKQVAEFAS